MENNNKTESKQLNNEFENLKNQIKNLTENLTKKDQKIDEKFLEIKRTVENQIINMSTTTQKPENIDNYKSFSTLMNKYLKK